MISSGLDTACAKAVPILCIVNKLRSQTIPFMQAPVNLLIDLFSIVLDLLLKQISPMRMS